MKKFIFLIFLPVPAWAAEEGLSQLLPASLKILSGLGIVLGLLLLLYALSRKGLLFFSSKKNGSIKIVEMRQLGGKKALCIIEVRGQEMLLSLSHERIELLSRLDPQKKVSSFEERLRSETQK